MMMQHKWITCGVSSFDDWLIVGECLESGQSYLFSWKCFKKTKVVSRRITENQQKKYCPVPEYNLEDFSHLQDVRTDHLGNEEKTRTVGCSKYHNLIVELIPLFQNGAESANVIFCCGEYFSWEEVLWCAEEATEKPEIFVYFTENKQI